jgi:hypothetical protein
VLRYSLIFGQSKNTGLSIIGNNDVAHFKCLLYHLLRINYASKQSINFKNESATELFFERESILWPGMNESEHFLFPFEILRMYIRYVVLRIYVCTYIFNFETCSHDGWMASIAALSRHVCVTLSESTIVVKFNTT